MPNAHTPINPFRAMHNETTAGEDYQVTWLTVLNLICVPKLFSKLPFSRKKFCTTNSTQDLPQKCKHLLLTRFLGGLFELGYETGKLANQVPTSLELKLKAKEKLVYTDRLLCLLFSHICTVYMQLHPHVWLEGMNTATTNASYFLS